MRLSLSRFKMPTNTKLYQDPVLGYFETHGKMRFIPGEDYGISDEEKKVVHNIDSVYLKMLKYFAFQVSYYIV